MLSFRRLPQGLVDAGRRRGQGIARVGVNADGIANFHNQPLSTKCVAGRPHPDRIKGVRKFYESYFPPKDVTRVAFFATDAKESGTEEDPNQQVEEPTQQSEEDPREEETISKRDTIVALLDSKEPGSVDKAVRCLQQMIVGAEKPDTALLEAILLALVQDSADPEATATQAQTVVDDMNKLYRKTKDSSFQPTLSSYRDLILAWSRANHPEQAEKVFLEQLLSPDSLRTATAPFKPVRAILGQSLNHVLSSWVASEKFEAGRRCQQIMTHKMNQGHIPKEIESRPNPETYHLANQAWMKAVKANSDKMNKKQFQEAATSVQQNVDFMIKRYEESSSRDWFPDLECYPWMILAYCYAGAPEKAEAILEGLIQANAKSDSSVFPHPTTQMYNHVLEARALRGQGQEAGILLSKWASRCQAQREKAGGDASATANREPNLDTCLWVIRAWGMFSDHYRAPRAEQILKRMWEVQRLETEYLRVLPAPTTEVYNAVLEAWSQSRHYKLVRACTSAERILMEMHHETDPEGKYHRFENPNPCWPTPRTYELVIETYARFGYNLADRKKRVNKLMRRMKHWVIEPTERTLQLVNHCQETGYRLE